MTQSAAARALGEPPNRLRYATLTGRVRMRWDGAKQPTIWMAPPPDIGPGEARLELARRYLHVFGPGDARGVRRLGRHLAAGRCGDLRRARSVARRPSARRSATDGSWRRTSPSSAVLLALRHPRGSCRAATPTSSSSVPTNARCWSRTPRTAAVCGRRASGQAPCSSTASSSAHGVARRRRSPSRRGVASHAPSVRPSTPRSPRCRCRGWPAVWQQPVGWREHTSAVVNRATTAACREPFSPLPLKLSVLNRDRLDVVVRLPDRSGGSAGRCRRGRACAAPSP